MIEIRQAAKTMLGLLEGLMAKPEQIVFAAGAGAWLEAIKVHRPQRDYAAHEIPTYGHTQAYRLLGFPLILDPAMEIDHLCAVFNGRATIDMCVDVSTGCAHEGKNIIEVLRQPYDPPPPPATVPEPTAPRKYRRKT